MSFIWRNDCPCALEQDTCTVVENAREYRIGYFAGSLTNTEYIFHPNTCCGSFLMSHLCLFFSVSYPGVFRGFSPGGHQHHRSGLRTAFQTVPQEPPQAGHTSWQVNVRNVPRLSPKCELVFVFSSPIICICHFSLRMAPFDGSAWEEEEDEAAPPPDVPYYNNFPGKQPPPGGLIDMRTRPGATLVRK